MSWLWWSLWAKQHCCSVLMLLAYAPSDVVLDLWVVVAIFLSRVGLALDSYLMGFIDASPLCDLLCVRKSQCTSDVDSGAWIVVATYWRRVWVGQKTGSSPWFSFDASPHCLYFCVRMSLRWPWCKSLSSFFIGISGFIRCCVFRFVFRCCLACFQFVRYMSL